MLMDLETDWIDNVETCISKTKKKFEEMLDRNVYFYLCVSPDVDKKQIHNIFEDFVVSVPDNQNILKADR